jgi:hypothetical protein
MRKLLLVLAQAPGRPNGDVEDRIELLLALTPQSQIDERAFREAPCPWFATRERPGHALVRSELIQLDGGWALQNIEDDGDDPLWALEGWLFRPGELVRLRRPDGAELLFRIVQVEQAEPPRC